MWFQFGGYWVELKPDDYIVDVSANKTGEMCQVMLLPNKFDFFIFGLPSFQGYYVIHDMKKSRMGVIPHDDSDKQFLKKGPVPTQILETYVASPASQVFIFTAILFIVIGVLSLEPWAKTKYGSSSMSYYIVLISYGIFAFFMTVAVTGIADSLLEGSSDTDMPD